MGHVTRQREPLNSRIILDKSLFLSYGYEPLKDMDCALYIFVFQVSQNYDVNICGIMME